MAKEKTKAELIKENDELRKLLADLQKTNRQTISAAKAALELSHELNEKLEDSKRLIERMLAFQDKLLKDKCELIEALRGYRKAEKAPKKGFYDDGIFRISINGFDL